MLEIVYIIFELTSKYTSFFRKMLIVNFVMMSSALQNRKIRLVNSFQELKKLCAFILRQAVFQKMIPNTYSKAIVIGIGDKCNHIMGMFFSY